MYVVQKHYEAQHGVITATILRTTTIAQQAANLACCTKCRRSVLHCRNYTLHVNFILMATVYTYVVVSHMSLANAGE